MKLQLTLLALSTLAVSGRRSKVPRAQQGPWWYGYPVGWGLDMPDAPADLEEEMEMMKPVKRGKALVECDPVCFEGSFDFVNRVEKGRESLTF